MKQKKCIIRISVWISVFISLISSIVFLINLEWPMITVILPELEFLRTIMIMNIPISLITTITFLPNLDNKNNNIIFILRISTLLIEMTLKFLSIIMIFRNIDYLSNQGLILTLLIIALLIYSVIISLLVIMKNKKKFKE